MGPWAPTLESLNARPLPAWYDQAKFGIFIHWGLWAIPAFAARLGSISDAFKTDYDRAVAMTPYTEWYANAIKVPGTPSAEFHAKTYGAAPYEAFREPFIEGLKAWDPAAWAESFRNAGALYVVLVTKHHDGFCLWPSGVRNPKQTGWSTTRDIVGELAAAVRAQGMRFGVYYSGGIDWTFNRRPILTLADFMGSLPGGRYPAYAEAQTRELIERYEPSVLWNDIAWPTDQARLNALFADYYNAVPEGVVNDRWRAADLASLALRLKPARRALDARIKKRMLESPDAVQGIIPPPVPHSDFRTPEYARFPDIQAKKWEATRGMSHSFGFNRNDTEDDYASSETLISDFIDGVAKNGNLLLNVGPMADGTIPEPQARRLKAFGDWLGAHGEAIYGSQPWVRAEAVTDQGMPVRFTVKSGDLYLTLLGRPTGERILIRDLTLAGEVRRLDSGAPVRLVQAGPDLALDFARPLDGAFAPVMRIRGAVASGLG
ncbi:alpha-L-fucosidase [Phenylobacterium montanum]|uniref:alpha-L-fucosidase n=1 Tax=Phenylobacterium montanum TaxID=2823693 RepID=A0A975ITQ8_9CAUL|nr:alpha-L-fucosidase [Caulobacter sp. S6]QUD86729.1 alpha-L-fucosidase [Caulobacter sp. S6]